MKKRGKCLICGIEGRGGKNFFCENCVNPQKILWFCKNCQRRMDLTEEELEKLYQDLKIDGPIRKGIVIIDEACPECTPNQDKNKGLVNIYAIKGG